MPNGSESSSDEQKRKDEDKAVGKRIKELGDKATQLLTFLSFAIVAAVVLIGTKDALGPCQKIALKWALRFWVLAFMPILLNVLPVKEFCWESPNWYRQVHRGKVVLLWLALILILCGVIGFLCTIW